MSFRPATFCENDPRPATFPKRVQSPMSNVQSQKRVNAGLIQFDWAEFNHGGATKRRDRAHRIGLTRQFFPAHNILPLSQ
jgi:hypothetical protein